MKNPTETYPIRRKLPTAYSTEIGRIITRYAYAKHLLRSTAYRLLRINSKQGRIAVREPRVADQITMIQDLATLAGIKLTADWKQLKKTMKELESFRHRFAHGIWVYHTGTKTPVLQDLSRAYTTAGNISPKPRINPVSIVITLRELRNITRNTDKAIDYLVTINRLVIHLMQETSPEKHP